MTGASREVSVQRVGGILQLAGNGKTLGEAPTPPFRLLFGSLLAVIGRRCLSALVVPPAHGLPQPGSSSSTAWQPTHITSSLAITPSCRYNCISMEASRICAVASHSRRLFSRIAMHTPVGPAAATLAQSRHYQRQVFPVLVICPSVVPPRGPPYRVSDGYHGCTVPGESFRD